MAHPLVRYFDQAVSEVASWHSSSDPVPALTAILASPWDSSWQAHLDTMLKSESAKVRSLGVAIIRELQRVPGVPERAVAVAQQEIRMKFAHETDVDVRWWVVSAIGFHQLFDMAPAVMNLQTDTEPLVRMAAASSLVALIEDKNRERVINALGLLAEDDDNDVRYEAISSLMELAGGFSD